VAIVPLEDLLFLERLEDEEDLRDLRALRAEAEREGTIPWDQLKASLGLESGDHGTSPLPARTDDEASAVDEIRVFHDAESRTLTIWFGRPEGERICEEVGGGVVLMKDGDGVVIGFEKLDFVAVPESLRLVLEGDCGGGDGTPTKGTESAPLAVPACGRTLRVENAGRVVGVLISEQDFSLFGRLLDAEENRRDLAAVREALREAETVSLEELEDELGR
jgi:PHD/YefM family antitoxin component YafN of YafNO toxin-antitoxin module